MTSSRKSQKKRRHVNRRIRALGWKFVHVAVDDVPRVAYVEVPANEQGATAAAFLVGITVQTIISDNGACYRSHTHARAARALAIERHLFTRPYRPRTNSKASSHPDAHHRWACGAIYGSSAD